MVLGAALLLSSCRDDEVEMQRLEFPLQFVLPVSEAQSLPRRAAGAGDPGQAEVLDLPHYAYAFLVFKMKNGREDIRYIDQTDLYDDGHGGTLTNADVWEWVDTLTTGGDVVYQCKIMFSEITPVLGQVEYCHAYAAMSKQPLTLSNTRPTSEAQVQNLTFTVTDALQPDLQNIYSTPYNYEVNDKYYGNLFIWADAIHANLMLYHVASKVDFMWNIPESEHTNMHITKVKAKNLFSGEAYLFRHTENVHAKFDGSGSPGDANHGYTPSDLAGDVAGTWWAGRTYFYTIPYTTTAGGQFPLQVEYDILNTSNSTTYTYDLTLTKTMPEVFAPWMRGQLTFTTPPTAGKLQAIDIDNL